MGYKKLSGPQIVARTAAWNEPQGEVTIKADVKWTFEMLPDSKVSDYVAGQGPDFFWDVTRKVEGYTDANDQPIVIEREPFKKDGEETQEDYDKRMAPAKAHFFELLDKMYVINGFRACYFEARLAAKQGN
jgi:hypothetical protein